MNSTPQNEETKQSVAKNESQYDSQVGPLLRFPQPFLRQKLVAGQNTVPAEPRQAPRLRASSAGVLVDDEALERVLEEA